MGHTLSQVTQVILCNSHGHSKWQAGWPYCMDEEPEPHRTTQCLRLRAQPCSWYTMYVMIRVDLPCVSLLQFLHWKQNKNKTNINVFPEGPGGRLADSPCDLTWWTVGNGWSGSLALQWEGLWRSSCLSSILCQELHVRLVGALEIFWKIPSFFRRRISVPEREASWIILADIFWKLPVCELAHFILTTST